MGQSLWFAEAVERLKKELFSPSAHLFALFPVSAYEMAWVAMVSDPDDPTRPMFPKCLDWVLRSQNSLGFWVDDHAREQYGLELDHLQLMSCNHQWSGADLMATLACLIALKTWEINGFFDHKINKGLKFLQDNLEKEVMEGGDEAGLRQWLLMVGLAEAKGLKVNNITFDELKVNGKVNGKAHKGEDEEMMERVIMKEIAFVSGRSALFRSPSATACAFMITGDEAFITYLQHLLTNCPEGVPPIYLLEKDVIKLCVVDHLERLGCAEHFTEEISDVMDQQYRKWIAEESISQKKDDFAFQIYKDSLAFRLLRMHGYQVSPRRFCWFINDEEMLSHMETNYTYFLGPMFNIYKASHIAFLEEHELDTAGVFSRKILQMGIMNTKSDNEINISYSLMKFEQEIEHELELIWLARMEYLEHRLYIERGGIYHFWTGKTAPCRILQNNVFLQLAIDNYMMRQLVYRKELNELHRWSKETGLSMMGFGREKTTYCYFAIASSSCLPFETDARKEAAKCAILITVADDFFDEKGSMHELSILTDAVQRWEGECLTSHSKVIFTALNNLVDDISLKTFKLYGRDVKKNLQDAWKEIFKSWLKEAEWSESSDHHPSIDQYIEIAKTSIAVEMMVLAACYLTNSKTAPKESCWDLSNTVITKSLMISCRLLNDLESYEKEAKAEKPNTVLLYLKENPEAKIDDAIAFVRNVLDIEKKKLLQLVMSRDFAGSDLPREWKDLHLSFLKVFQMFFNSTNAFDSPTMLLKSINKTIYEPLEVNEITSQPAHFSGKEFKITKTRALYKRAKINRASNKSASLSFDLNVRTDKKLHNLSFAYSFMPCNNIYFKSMI